MFCIFLTSSTRQLATVSTEQLTIPTVSYDDVQAFPNNMVQSSQHCLTNLISSYTLILIPFQGFQEMSPMNTLQNMTNEPETSTSEQFQNNMALQYKGSTIDVDSVEDEELQRPPSPIIYESDEIEDTEPTIKTEDLSSGQLKKIHVIH